MFWLYFVIQNNDNIDAVKVTGCKNEKVGPELKKIKKLCLAPNPEVANEFQPKSKYIYFFEVLAASTSATSDYMEQMTKIQCKNSEES